MFYMHIHRYWSFGQCRQPDNVFNYQLADWVGRSYFRGYKYFKSFRSITSFNSLNWASQICVSKSQAIFGANNGLSPVRRQAFVATSYGVLLFGLSGKKLSEIWMKRQQFSFRKMYMKMPSAKWRPFCLDLNLLIYSTLEMRFQANRRSPPQKKIDILQLNLMALLRGCGTVLKASCIFHYITFRFMAPFNVMNFVD